MDTRMGGGPSTIAEDAARDVAGEEAGVERRTDWFPCTCRLVQCEASKGIIPCWMGLWGQPCGPPKAIRGSGETGAYAVLRVVEGSITPERMACWMGETARERMEELHAGCLMSNERWVARSVCVVVKPGRAEFRGRYGQWGRGECVGEVGSRAERGRREERAERGEEEEWTR